MIDLPIDSMDHEQVGVKSLDRSNNNVQVEAVINVQSTARFTQTTVVHSEERLISNKPETKGTEIEPEIQSEPADGLSGEKACPSGVCRW